MRVMGSVSRGVERRTCRPPSAASPCQLRCGRRNGRSSRGTGWCRVVVPLSGWSHPRHQGGQSSPLGWMAPARARDSSSRSPWCGNAGRQQRRVLRALDHVVHGRVSRHMHGRHARSGLAFLACRRVPPRPRASLARRAGAHCLIVIGLCAPLLGFACESSAPLVAAVRCVTGAAALLADRRLGDHVAAPLSRAMRFLVVLIVAPRLLVAYVGMAPLGFT